MAAFFQAGTQGLPSFKIRGCKVAPLETAAAGAQASHDADGSTQHEARRGSLAACATSLMVAGGAKQLFQIVVRPWQIGNVVAVE